MSEHNHPLTPPCPACEAAAIARYAEGLAREVRDRYCAMQHSGNKKPCGPDAHMGWVRALLAIPGAQEAQS
jgi:hypothetical protein